MVHVQASASSALLKSDALQCSAMCVCRHSHTHTRWLCARARPPKTKAPDGLDLTGTGGFAETHQTRNRIQTAPAAGCVLANKGRRTQFFKSPATQRRQEVNRAAL